MAGPTLLKTAYLFVQSLELSWRNQGRQVRSSVFNPLLHGVTRIIQVGGITTHLMSWNTTSGVCSPNPPDLLFWRKLQAVSVLLRQAGPTGPCWRGALSTVHADSVRLFSAAQTSCDTGHDLWIHIAAIARG